MSATETVAASAATDRGAFAELQLLGLRRAGGR